jgi:hypothetical protein
MAELGIAALRVVDGTRLDAERRDALAPGGTRRDADGRRHELPRYFYEIESWDQAMQLRLTPNFGLHELVQTDVREARALHTFPRYVPCALPLLALALERFRDAVGTFVHVEANGGYRSPGHQLSRAGASTHCWGTAANIYMIGDTMLDEREAIERYAQIARAVIPGAWTRPYGTGRGETDDHLHVDLGHVLCVPRNAPVFDTGEVLP